MLSSLLQSISVSSQEGVGSCFTVLLPKARRNSASLRALEPELPEQNSLNPNTSEPNLLEREESLLEKPLQKTNEKSLILLADDDQLNQKVAKAQLKKLNYEVDLASSGEEVIEIFSDKQYSLVFVDYYMSGMTGAETAQKLRNFFQVETIPIIALTGFQAEPEELLDWKKSGINDVLLKPFNLEQLEAILNKWLR